MQVSTSAVVAGVAGGALWAARFASGSHTLLWLGAALMTYAAAGFGAGLVSRGAAALRWTVGACLAALCWSLVSMVRTDHPRPVDGVIGVVVLVVSVLVGRASRAERRRSVVPAGRRIQQSAPRRRMAGAHAR